MAVPEPLAMELGGRNLEPAERAVLLLRHWLAQARQAGTARGGVARGLYHARPGSLAQLDAYRKSRAWVPEGHEGKVLPQAGAFYLATAGRFFVATGNAWSSVGARPGRALITVSITALIILIIAYAH